MTWHAEELLPAYAAGQLHDAQAASVDAHVMACEHCRAALTAHVDRGHIEAIWDGIVTNLHAPRATIVEAVLLRLRTPSATARLVAGTPALSPPWLGGIAAALAFALAGAYATGVRGVLGFLLLAPVLPVAAVAASYGRGVDPVHDLIVAAPMDGLRLLLLRAAAVVGSTSVLTVLAALALPVRGWVTLAWLLPSLALTTISLALGRWVPLRWAACGLTAGWIAVVAATAGLFGRDPLLNASAFSIAGQLVCAAALAVAAATLMIRHDSGPRRHGGAPLQ